MSLSILSNDEIIRKFEYRWPRMCLDHRFWEIDKVVDHNPYREWQEIKFERDNYHALNHLDGQQGIYMFVVKARDLFTKHHCYILYIGETKNLMQRFKTYFSYINSKHPSDQKKRRMVLIWGEHLYFNYFTTNHATKPERVSEEYDLIDSISPPMNDHFRSEVLSAYKKALDF